ncbi:MAG: biotin synthase BioB [Candidatus Omnitrophica bacterium]|nr:biotin synthase BioB [Candidatus Omnitrophota bacterium]
MIPFINGLKERVLHGGCITRDEARRLIEIPVSDRDTINHLINAAQEITQKLSSVDADLCSLVNAKSGNCTEDCGFCSQSSHYQTDVNTYEMLTPEQILASGQAAEARGVDRFCVVTAMGVLNDNQFEEVMKGFQLLHTRTKLRLEASIGGLTKDRLERLKTVGVTRINHNLETSPDYYSKIVTTHSFSDRVETIRNCREAGMEVCSGGILGMGETREDRLSLAFELAKLDVEVMPINVLNPRPGTLLEHVEKIEPMEVIKTVAVFRFILPKACLKLGGGREVNLGPYQELAMRAGVNGLIVGGYLTTAGGPVERDREMMERAGYRIPEANGSLSSK